MPNPNDKELKELSRESISTALCQLLEKRNYDDISITDIAKRAGVSRMAFYRNYETKDDILVVAIDTVFQEFFDDIILRHLADGTLYQEFFHYFRNHKALVSAVIKSKRAPVLIDLFDKYLTVVYNHFLKQGIVSGASPYEIHYAAGGFYNVLIHWYKNDFAESDEEMGRILENISGYITLHI